MGSVVYSLNVSLDGFVEAPDGSLGWANVDEELHRWFNDGARAAGVFVYGRRMYELMSAYWPHGEIDPEATPAMVEFARIWRATPKVVVSSTLADVQWNSRLARGSLVSEIERLRDEVDGDVGVGGATLAAELIRRDLVDEYRPAVHPVLLGSGTPFYPALDRPLDLRLEETRSLESGVVISRYVRANASQLPDVAGAPVAADRVGELEGRRRRSS
jgi:dihydrofolate reductase